jgi:hypothetical protein
MLVNRAIAAVLAAGLVAGCSPVRVSDLADDKHQRARDYQLGAGLNVVEWDGFVCNTELKACGPKNLRMIGGKEQDRIRIALYTTDGTKVLDYEAEQVKAFDGQAIRAEVEKALADADVEATTAIVDSLVDAARRAVTGGL